MKNFISSSGSAFQTGTSARYTFDVMSNRFIEMDESMGEITGIPRDEFLEKTPQEALSEVAEMSHIEAIGEFMMRSLQSLIPQEQIENTTLNMIYNIKTRENDYKRLHVKYRIAKHEGPMPLILEGITTDITHFQKDGLPTFFLVQNNKVVYWEEANPDLIVKKSTIPLSRTEINLLRLTSAGNSPEEISSKMNISISTLYTHRKNIKAKMGHDINYVIALLREKGIIS
jgi:DNA-binding CsgD family transcriptional regulator